MIDLNLKRILVLGWLWVLELIFLLLEDMNEFYKVFRMFFFSRLKYGWKWVFLSLKQINPIFQWQEVAENLGKEDDTSPIIFLQRIKLSTP
jgi:uncharacterized membrane protein